MKNFKKLNVITHQITKSLFKKYKREFILINQEWKNIVGSNLNKVSYPKKLNKYGKLIVCVESNHIIEFQYDSPRILKNIEDLLGKNTIINIGIIQIF